DINLLASKINDAYTSMAEGAVRAEKKARDIMIHIDDYTTVKVDDSVKEAVQSVKQSFESIIASSRLMETGHRSVLVFDKNRELAGILSIRDLIEAVRPAYLSAPKPSMADSIQYSPIFWSGLFTNQVKKMADKRVGDIMSGAPLTVDEESNLMEMADLMFTKRVRRLVVTSKGKVVGVVREQELFFEMANIIL
ncbi:MAG TPA: CBS domain-containing protein, partial [Desulfobacteraceae bacterium]|nr:CBS domain-containing protein [Desulfobacteraceae bacterium]